MYWKTLLRIMLMVVAMIPLVSAPAQAEWSWQRKLRGPEIGLGGGMNFCSSSGKETNCDSIDPSWAFMASVGYRPIYWSGVYLEGTYSQLKATEGSGKFVDTDLFAVIKLFLWSAREGDFWLAGGAGYSSRESSGFGSDIEWKSWQNFKVGIGAIGNISKSMGFGFALEYFGHLDNKGELCDKSDCIDNEEWDILDNVKLMALMRIKF